MVTKSRRRDKSPVPIQRDAIVIALIHGFELALLQDSFGFRQRLRCARPHVLPEANKSIGDHTTGRMNEEGAATMSTIAEATAAISQMHPSEFPQKFGEKPRKGLGLFVLLSARFGP